MKYKLQPYGELREVSDAAVAAYQDHQQSWQSFAAAVGLQVQRAVLGHVAIASTPRSTDSPLRAIWGRRSGKSSLTAAAVMRQVYGDSLPEPEPPDPQLVAEACDPTTPPERLAELDEGDRHSPLWDCTTRNPNLPQEELRERLLDGVEAAWFNPALSLALLEVDPCDIEALASNAVHRLAYAWRSAERAAFVGDRPARHNTLEERWHAAVQLVDQVEGALPPRLSVQDLQHDRELLRVIGRVMGWHP